MLSALMAHSEIAALSIQIYRHFFVHKAEWAWNSAQKYVSVLFFQIFLKFKAFNTVHDILY